MAFSESAPPSRPPLAASEQDLTDAEFVELDELLAGVPEPLEPLDVVMLDGFLAGVIVQPELIASERWLPHVFDAGGHRWGEAEPTLEQQRVRELIARRHAAMNRSLAEFGGFNPLILEPDEADDGSVAEEPGAPVLDATTRAILPWVAGFEFAASIFPAMYELEDEAVATILTRLYRFLPAEGADEEATAELLAKERPLATLDAAIEEVVSCVGELYDLTAPLRYQVETVRRAAPKVGRNDPCPCGSGRKFKVCHGAGA
ncbi:MAG: UPF0149 family protein [Caldimonas sp.]